MTGADKDASREESPHVLVIEDDPGIGRLISLTLSLAGCRVTVMANGEAGLSVAKAGAPDVVLLDLTLPGLSGAEILAAVQETSRAPVVILTAVDSEDLLAECVLAGAFDVALKPFDPDDLETCVRLAAGAGTAHSNSLPPMHGRDFELDFSSYRFTKAGNRYPLSLSEWRLLELLASRPGQTVLYQELLGRAWGPRFRNRRSFLLAWIARLERHFNLAEFHGIGYALMV